MAPRYAHSQLTLLLMVAGVAGLGLAVGAWRQAYPELADRIERFDIDAAAASEPAAGADARRREPAPSAAAPSGSPARGRVGPAPGGGTAPSSWRLDPNQATASELARLPGIGPVQAARIVAAREAGGPFASVDDLARVRGLGPARIERLRPLLTIGAPSVRERP